MEESKRNSELGVVGARLRWLVPLMVLGFSALAMRLFELQVFRHDELTTRARDNVVQTLRLPAPRGTIRDARGRPLAIERRVHTQSWASARFNEDNREEHRGFLSRSYPLGAAAAHLVGYVAEVPPEELERSRGRDTRRGDLVGRIGVERALEDELRGRDGWAKMVVDAHGRPMAEPFQKSWIQGPRTLPPENGHGVTLTVDASIQGIVHRAMPERPGGGAVIVEVETGRILALVSAPSFDPEIMVGGPTPRQLNAMMRDSGDPFFNRPLMGLYAPSTTLDAFSAIAALREGGSSATERERCVGSNRCRSAHGVLNLRQAIARSCHTYFSHLAERPGMWDAITWQATQFGLGEATGMGISGAINPDNTTVTVLQMAMAYAAIANGGTLYEPQVVERIETAEGLVVRQFEPRARRRLDLSPRHRDEVVEAMVEAFERFQSDDERNLPSDIEVAGLTDFDAVLPESPASATNVFSPEGGFSTRHHTWFVGFAPVDAPQIALALVIERGSPAVESAVPVAIEILRRAFEPGSTWAQTDSAGD